MTRILLLILSALILAALNFGIYQKQQIISTGETIFLELAPVDPRSLMQGDYMRLAYGIERKIGRVKAKQAAKRGYLVIRVDASNVARFVRFHNNVALTTGEKLIKYQRKGTRIQIVPRSYFFQEGHGKFYNRAKYGVFKFDAAGNKLLVGLAGVDRQIIKPDSVD